MTKKPGPNRYVMLNLGLMKIRLVSASGLLFFWYQNILSDKNSERKEKTEERSSGRYLGRE